MSRNSKKHLLRRNRRLKCVYCQRLLASDQVVADHAIPLSRGGLDKMDNIVVACHTCDHLKGPLTAEEFMALRQDDVARKELIRQVQMNLQTEPGNASGPRRRKSR